MPPSDIAVIVVKGRDDEEIRALRLALNRIPQETRWDDEKLHREVQDLLALGLDMELTGFDAVEVDMSLSIEDPGAGAVEEESVTDLEPTGEAPFVSLGDAWLLGRHIVAPVLILARKDRFWRGSISCDPLSVRSLLAPGTRAAPDSPCSGIPNSNDGEGQ